MRSDLKILGLTLGDPFSPLSRSGVNFNIFTRLAQRSRLVNVLDLDLRGIAKMVMAIRNFSPDRRVWGNKLHQNPTAFNIRTGVAEKKLSTVGPIDLIYQDGAMFMPGWNPKVPYVSYHDSNVMLSVKGKPYSQGAHYTSRDLERTIGQEGLVYRNASLIFSMSNWLKKSFVDDFGISEEKIVTVYAGTNLEVEDFDKEFDGKTILFVGRNFDRKGGKILLEAFKQVRKEVRGARLIIIGPDLSVDIEGVKTIGPTNDKTALAEYFRQASVFALPSFYEPFGIVFAEAFAHKLPCIGVDACAMPEIIEHGKGGFVIPPGDSKVLSNRLIELLQDTALSNRMGEYGFNKAKTVFNWDVVVEKMLVNCARFF